MACGGKAVFGGTWRSSLVRVDYEDDIVTNFEESRKLDKIIRDEASLSASPVNSRITKVTSYSTNLGGLLSKVNALRNIAKHHFLELETEGGNVFTLEKSKDCIMQQSCPRPVGDAVPIVRKQRNGDDRPKSKLVAEDLNPRNKSVLDIIKWIHDSEELMEPYNVVDSNCQDFCKNLWSELIGRPYPNPSKIAKKSAEKCPSDPLQQSSSPSSGELLLNTFKHLLNTF